jgi:tetratricopeptide (TPR) repeat protein
VGTDRWRRLEDIFHEALECAPTERAALLTAACGDDTELRAEVESLLDAHEKETFLQNQKLPARLASALLGAAALGSPETVETLLTTDLYSRVLAPPAVDHPPERLGPYTILEPLGRGGMGVVYRGQHTETGQIAAIKTITVPNETLLASFRREIHALARLRHPGIVRILDEGVDDGLPWYAMEVLEGTSLRAFARNRSQLAIALTLARRLCAPLAFLHGEGIVHRDLKPDNVLVSREGRPILVDFGLASFFAGTSGREALELVQGGGTILYTAPEQILGEPVDARADLYSLGCVLYELLTGKPPFVARTANDLAVAHLQVAPAPPSTIVPGLPPALDDLVLRLLAKEPSERVGHADAVAAALAGLGAGDSPPSDEPSPRAYLYRARFAGREHAMGDAARHLDRLATGAGGLLFVEGESGVGKTRFALEVAREGAERAAHVLAGECSPQAPRDSSVTGGAPLAALRRPLQTIADRCRERGQVETDRLLGARGKLLALYEPALTNLPGQEAYPAPVELMAGAARLRLNAYLAETFGALAASRPVVMILDDLQGADELTLDFLAHLLRGGYLERKPILVVGTYRSEEQGEGLRELIAAPRAAHIRLGRLEETAVDAVLSDMLALSPPPSSLSQYLCRHSEGNPFFVTEYLRAAVEDGLLARDGAGRWRFDAEGADLERLGTPGSLRDLLRGRVANLPPVATRAAEAAAVLGREVDTDLLAHTAGIREGELLDALGELIRRHVLEDTGTGRLRFAHDKIREVVYDDLGPKIRAALHRAAAVAVERSEAAGSQALAAALGRHWEEAGEVEKARGYYLVGAREAEARYAHGEAEQLYRAYLRLAVEPTPERVTARIELGNLLRMVGRTKIAADEHELALEEARGAGLPGHEATALRLLGLDYAELGQLEEARGLFVSALDSMERLGDRSGAALTLRTLGITHVQQGRPEEACALFEKALALHREDRNRSEEAVALSNLAAATVDTGRVDEAMRYYEEALKLHREAGSRRSEAIAMGNFANLLINQGRLDEARPLLDETLRIKREVGDRRGEGITLGNLALLVETCGQLEEARAFYEAGLAIQREIGDRLSEGDALTNLGILTGEMGDGVEARRLLREALEIHRDVGNRRFEGLTLNGLGALDIAEGRLESARARLSEALAVHRATGETRYQAFVLLDEAALERVSEDLPRAEELLDRAEALLKEHGDRTHLALCLCERGHLALALNRPARALLDEAARAVEALGAGPASQLGKAVAKLERAVMGSG